MESMAPEQLRTELKLLTERLLDENRIAAMRQQISAALSVVIQISRLSDGKRKITSLQEITGVEGDIENMQEIFKFEQTGLDASGAVLGRFLATGIRPKFEHRLRTRGVILRDDLYDPARNRD
jgi:pilus assembly protein CpaF